ncbi:MAG TPA: acetate--CoA ligase family protein [Spirochaetia bacterium]|nr:acetate--CoA ligase family protein [Spirochaetales bacterium]HRS64686.1 acetate--CoA ligase family protein [Spirochaetia bacterium]HRV27820.1 acetate--CoA ligase family protein [Spirochaetia bacterium]
MDEITIRNIVEQARSENRDALTEYEGLAVLKALDIPAPRNVFIKNSQELGAGMLFEGPKAVVKVISPEILHKTEMGGVQIVDNNFETVHKTIQDMEARFKNYTVHGYTVNEFIPYDTKLGHEIIIGYRFARDFGPIISFGPGGIYTEFLAKQFIPGKANVFFSPLTASPKLVEKVLATNAVRNLLAGGLRGTKIALEETVLVNTIMKFIDAANTLANLGITEFEINPFVVTKDSRLIALDVLIKLGSAGSDIAFTDSKEPVNINQKNRPVNKIKNILQPVSAAVIGVSEKGMNNGRIILRNLIENGFDTKRLYVVKPGLTELDGCKCVPDVQSLPEKVDLFVLVIPAAQAPQCIAELAELDKAESVIVIPGGLEEKSGTEDLVARMKQALAKSRTTVSRGPLLNGGNCLGIRSVPGKYNTLFIPEYKLPMPKGKVAPMAVISQSGAFAICRISKHPDINPKYVITCGNQMDVTIGDYLEYLEQDKEITTFAVYVEGFKPLDGAKVLSACKKIIASGRTVIFYRAGRTAAGAAASASHTASIAGDYPVTRELLKQIGVVVAESLDEFDDAMTMFSLLEGKQAKGYKLGAVSNAGFECVAFADNLGSLSLTEFSASSHPKLEAIFKDAKISDIVDVHNPVDLTPMADDTAYYETFKAVLEDENVDTGIVGIVPLTVRMNTLAKGEGHTEDVTLDTSIAGLYGKLIHATKKPWVAVVDSGALYDPLARELERRGVPTFRTADRALAMLNIWLKAKGA